MADPIIPIFGEEFCQKLFSKHRGLREMAIEELINEYPNSRSNMFKTEDKADIYIACLSSVSELVSDRLTLVSTKLLSLKLLDLLMRKPAKI